MVTLHDRKRHGDDWLRQPMLRRPVDDKLLSEIVRRIRRVIEPERIILFGSHSRGTAHEFSDIDVLVEADVSGIAAAHDAEEAIHGALLPRAVPIDVLVRTPRYIAERRAAGDPFMEDVVVRGRILYERDSARHLADAGA